MKVGIAGCGGIGLACAAWIATRGHAVTVWSPQREVPPALQQGGVRSTGALEATVKVTVAETAKALADDADVLLVAVPLNGHGRVMDALLPHLRAGLTVIVSAMNSLSSLYLFEGARRRGIALSVVSFGTTALTARRRAPDEVHILTRRGMVGVSCLPRQAISPSLELCEALFGDGFTADENVLASALTNINPVAHAPLAIFNWTRIERAEAWPQYHFMTSRVSAVIEQLDRERIEVARAFGLSVRSIERHFARSFGIESTRLDAIAAELHTRRGGPPGPTDTRTRFLGEDVPYGLVFTMALGQIAGVTTPATDAIAATAGLVFGKDFLTANDLIHALRLPSESRSGLLARVNAER